VLPKYLLLIFGWLKFLTVSILLLGPNLVAQENRLIVNADQGKEIVSRHIYGHFAEHLGRCIYEGFWVGEGSPIPNLRGIRTDVIEALEKARIPVIRWPGGCLPLEGRHWPQGSASYYRECTLGRRH
jgi:alpha-N-arabinofuranosidase